MATQDYVDDAPQVIQPTDDASAVIDLTGQQEPEGAISVDTEPTTQMVQPTDEGEDWQHKYEVLKGKYDKEVPRLHREIKLLKREKEDLLKRLALLESVVTNIQQQQRQAPQAPSQDIEDEELKRFAEEYPEVYKSVAKLLEKKLKTVEATVQSQASMMAQQNFYSRLTALVPDWERLNTDPDFIDWLQEPEGETGFTRHQLMLMAFEKGDADRVASFFKRFIAQSQQDGSQSPYKARADKNVYPPQRKQVQQEPSKKMFTESEIKEFYRLSALGKIDPKKKQALEAEILSALAENRVIYGK